MSWRARAGGRTREVGRDGHPHGRRDRLPSVRDDLGAVGSLDYHVGRHRVNGLGTIFDGLHEDAGRRARFDVSDAGMASSGMAVSAREMVSRMIFHPGLRVLQPIILGSGCALWISGVESYREHRRSHLGRWS